MTDKDMQPWQWPEAHWRRILNQARAGRALRPQSWPDGARCAFALSFDSDHETNELRDGGRLGDAHHALVAKRRAGHRHDDLHDSDEQRQDQCKMSELDDHGIASLVRLGFQTRRMRA